MLAVSAAPSFSKVAKKLHARDKKVLDEAVKAVLSKPSCQSLKWAKKKE